MRSGALGSELLSVGLRHTCIVGDVVDRGSQHVSCASVYLFVVVECILDLLHINWLVVLVQQLNLVLSQKLNDLVLNVFLFESLENQISFVGTELFSDPISYFATDFFHNFHIRSLSHLC